MLIQNSADWKLTKECIQRVSRVKNSGVVTAGSEQLQGIIYT